MSNCLPSNAAPVCGRRMVGDRLYPLLIVVAAGAAYLNSFHGEFVYDDVKVLADNPALQQFWPPWQWLAFCPMRPVVYATFAANYALHGTETFGYLVVNVVIHIATALLLYGLIRRTLLLPATAERYQCRAGAFALAVSTVWVVHPLCTQAVTYVYQRLEALASLFVVAALYAFVRAYSALNPPRRKWWIALSLLSCYLALFSKESAAGLPLLLVLYDYLFIGRTRCEVGNRVRFHCVALGGLCLMVALMTITADNYAKAGLGDVVGLSPLGYALSQSGVILHYLRLSFLPIGLCLDYGWPAAERWPDYLPQTLVMLSCLAATGWGILNARPWSFPAAAFFLLLAPSSSIVPIIDLAYEHRIYLPLAAVVCLAGCVVVELIDRFARPDALRRIGRRVFCGVGVVVVLLALLTHRRNEDYRTYETMWRDVASKAYPHARPHANIARACGRRGDHVSAEAEARRALELDPNYPPALLHHSAALWKLGRPEEALPIAERAVAATPDRFEAFWVLANVLRELGRNEETAAVVARALQLHPQEAAAFASDGIEAELGAVYRHRRENRLDRAAELVADIIRRAPTSSAAWTEQGIVFSAAGDDDRAVESYRRAVVLDDRNSVAHNNLGMLTARRDPQAAVPHFEAALRADPRHVGAYNNLGNALVKLGRIDEALECYRKALELNPDDPQAGQNYQIVLRMRRGESTAP